MTRCPYPFYQLTVNSNGDVVVCCAPIDRKDDWFVIGNVLSQDINSMWNGESHMNILESIIKNKGLNKRCCNCKYLEVVPQTDLIEIKEEVLLEKFGIK